MKIGEIWFLNEDIFTLWSKPADEPMKGIDYQIHDLERGDCFTILDVIVDNDREYQVCVLFNNQKWYFEVAKYSMNKGLFKKLCQPKE